MSNAILIILSIAFTFILIAVNIYLLALYVHTDDKGWGTAIYCKVLVVLGLTLCQAQALMVPLDVANESSVSADSLDMKGFWYFLYIIILIFVCLLIPYAIFFYQTDQEDGYCKRIGYSIVYTLLANIISIVLLFVTWNFFKFVDLPIYQVKSSSFSGTATPKSLGSISQTTNQNGNLELQTSFAVYIIAILSFFGWVLVVVCGGVGLFALPIDMINQFRHRPKARKSEQMRKTKINMVRAINVLIKEGEQLKKGNEDHQKNDQAGFFQKWQGGRQINNKLTEYKAKYHTLSDQYDIFNLQLKFADTNPIVPVLKLVLGIIFMVTTIMWILQIIFGNIAKGYLNRPLIPFMNQLLIGLENGNAGFLATFIFAYLCLYMLWCMQKGTVKFGVRVPCCCRFHPMKQNQTWMNSFLFNIIVMLIASVGVIQLCISSFPTYTRNSQAYMIFGIQLNYMRFYRAFYDNNVFPIALIIWTFLTLIYLLFTCNKKPAYMKEIQKIRNHQE